MADDLNALLGEALAHHRAGRLKPAADGYRRVLELAPETPDAWHLLGLVANQAGDHDAAIRMIGRALEIAPAASFYCSLGNAQRAAGDGAASITAYRSAIELDPDFADAWNNLAVALRSAGDVDGAIEASRRALALRADHPDALLNLGKALQRAARTGEAIAAFRRAIEATPGDADARASLGEALLTCGDVEAAIESLSAARALAPRDAIIAINLGQAEQQRGRLDVAEAFYREAVELDPDNAIAWNNLGTRLQDRAEFESASQAFETAVRLDPDYVDAHYNFGVACTELGDPERALAQYRRALELDAKCFRAYSMLVALLSGLGRREDASAVGREWLRHCPDDSRAAHIVAAFDEDHVPARASDDYVRSEFDEFAAEFDAKLASLDYRGPELVMSALREHLPEPAGQLSVLDAGCGTGLCGPPIRPFARRLVGVDLSSGMIEKARERAVYDELVVAELTAHLETCDAEVDAVIAADTLIYFGALEGVMNGASRVLRPGGLLAFTVEAEPGAPSDGFRLNPHGRYSHTTEYVERTLAGAGLELVTASSAVIRTEAQRPVPGMVVVARKPA